MMRLYSGRSREPLMQCDGCHAPILHGDKIVVRQDGAVFCNLPCAMANDDTPIDVKEPARIVA